MNTSVKRIPIIDLVKYICAVLVVFYHTANVVGFSGIAGTVCHTVWSIARYFSPVEFFFLVSAFFLFKKCPRPKKLPNGRPLWRYVGRLIKLYLLWAVLYLPIIAKSWAGKSFSRCAVSLLKQLLLTGYSTHTWYIPSLLYGTIAVFLLLRYTNRAVTGTVVGVLTAICLLGSNYAGLYPHCPPVEWLYRLTGSPALLRSFIYVFIGACMACTFQEHPERFCGRRVIARNTVLWLIFGTLSLVELKCTVAWGLARNNDASLMSIFTVWALLRLLLCLRETLIRRADALNTFGIVSSFVYFSHMLIREGFLLLATVKPLAFLSNGFVLWGAVTVCATAIGLLLHRISGTKYGKICGLLM